ncbi:MAG: hypothetical protein HUK02_07010, partial [Bacteroidaceae bacterium]|nr:hypothetical protein [Bacteroidaceae bacterium]
MKKFTLFFIAALTALAMTAAPAQKGLRQTVRKSMDQQSMAEKAVKKMAAAPLATLTKQTADSRMRKAPKAAAEGDAIMDRPAGEHQYYLQWGDGFTLMDDYLFNFPVETAGEMVWAADNVVYLRNAISSLRDVGWVKGTRSADGKKITVKLPQHVSDMEGYNEQGEMFNVPLYVSVMKYDKDSDNYYRVDDADNVVTYTIGDDGKIEMDGGKEIEYIYDPDTDEDNVVMPETMLTCYYEYAPDGDGVLRQYWYGFSDVAQTFTPLPADIVVNEYPAELNFELWALTDAVGLAQSVDVAIVGNEVFMKGFDSFTADCVVKGTIEGDKVIFPSKQFFGIHKEWGDFMFFFGCTYGMRWYEEFQDYYEGYGLADKLEMNFDAEKRVMTAPAGTGFVMNASFERLLTYSEFLEPVIASQKPEDLNAAPADPEFVYFENYEDYQQGYFAWFFPNTNVNNAFIDVNKVYYNVFINGELYTFTPEVYPYVMESMTDLPYNYSDENSFDIAASGIQHEFYIYGENFKSMGVELHYLAPDGVLYSSNRVTYNIADDTVETEETAVTAASAKPVAMEFTNLQGVRVKTPTPGNIYLRTVKFSDGSKKTSKFLA